MVEWTEEENYKFRLSSFKQSLIDWLEGSPDCKSSAIIVVFPVLHHSLTGPRH